MIRREKKKHQHTLLHSNVNLQENIYQNQNKRFHSLRMIYVWLIQERNTHIAY